LLPGLLLNELTDQKTCCPFGFPGFPVAKPARVIFRYFRGHIRSTAIRAAVFGRSFEMYLSPVYHIFASLSGQLVADTEGSPVSKGQGSGPDVGLLVPTSLPSYAEHLDPQLVAFSIEADRWPDWAGHKVGEPNPYTQQLLANLQQRIGLPPAIRVGGKSTSYSAHH